MNKKIIIFITLLLLLSPICCFAEEVDSESKNIVYDTINGEDYIMTRSNNLPTTGLDLSIQSYKVNISNINNRWYYSNVYFIVASNKRIVVNYTLSSGGNNYAHIGLYDMTSGSFVSQTTGLNGVWTVNNLNTSHKYVVAFKSHSSIYTINGSAIVTN